MQLLSGHSTTQQRRLITLRQNKKGPGVIYCLFTHPTPTYPYLSQAIRDALVQPAEAMYESQYAAPLRSRYISQILEKGYRKNSNTSTRGFLLEFCLADVFP